MKMAIEDTPQEDQQTALRNQEIKRGFEGILDDVNRKLMSPEFHKQIAWSLVSIILALLVSAVIMLMTGYDPGAAFFQLAIGAITRMDQVIWRATPLILTGLSVALAFKCGLFNIGPEGQLYIGSMAKLICFSSQTMTKSIMVPMVTLKYLLLKNSMLTSFPNSLCKSMFPL